MKYFFLSLVMFCFLQKSYAQTYTAVLDTSTPYSYFLFTVKGEETLFEISTLCNASLTEIISLNPKVKEDYVKTGDKLRIPIGSKPANNDSIGIKNRKYIPVYYTLQASQSLAFLKRQFKVSMAQLRTWNNLTNDNLPIGKAMIVWWVEDITKLKEIQIHNNGKVIIENRNEPTDKNNEVTQEKKEIIMSQTPQNDVIEVKQNTPLPISNETIKEVPNTSVNTEKTSNSNQNSTLASKYNQQLSLGIESSEDGFGKWFVDTNPDSNPDWCLHKYLPKGSIVKFTNFFDGRVRYFKVMGKLPPSGENEGILIRISEKAAKEMKIFDKRFKCTVAYVQ